jgi:hypothetical protein
MAGVNPREFPTSQVASFSSLKKLPPNENIFCERYLARRLNETI